MAFFLTAFRRQVALEYLSGLGCFLSSEALPNSLPLHQNSPQICPRNLYAEQYNHTPFTFNRFQNKYNWLYRTSPSVHFVPRRYRPILTYSKWIGSQSNSTSPSLTNSNANSHLPYPLGKGSNEKHASASFISTWEGPPFCESFPPLQYRWNAFKSPQSNQRVNFVESIITIAGNGNLNQYLGGAVSNYNFNVSMNDMEPSQMHNSPSNMTPISKSTYLINQDAEMLILPVKGELQILTEFGELNVRPLEVAWIPRGIYIQINASPYNDTLSSYSGYLVENFGMPFSLPEPSVLGCASALAHPRHFLSPVAKFDMQNQPSLSYHKFQGSLWQGILRRSPFNVIAWYGNHLPCKYDINLFTAINTVSHDHPDPSINTVLTSLSSTPGMANLDFVVFPSSMVVAQNTFRPPYFHRNTMSELMGSIQGNYAAKATGFDNGGYSIHNQYCAHGPDSETYNKAIMEDTTIPKRISGSLAFMIESCNVWCPTPYSLYGSTELQTSYAESTWDQFQETIP